METEIAGLNDTLQFLMEHLGDTQTSIGRVIGLSQPQVGKRLDGTPPWKYVELLTIADHWGIPITTMLGGKSAAARWLSDQILIVADLRERPSTWDGPFRTYEPRLFDPDGLPDVIDLRDHIVAQKGEEGSPALYAAAS